MDFFRKRVLFVDDEPAIRRVAELSLRRAGFQVDSVASGEEALELLKQKSGDYGAMMIDLNMRGIDGIETIRAVRALQPDLGCVLVSGEGLPFTAAGEDMPRIDACIQKPFHPSELGRVLLDRFKDSWRS